MDTKKLRQKILDLAIHGKLVPQDPNDEPASVLLERIRAEKEKLIKEGKIKAPKKSKSAGDTSHYPKDVPFAVPEGWVWCRLEDIAYVAAGSTPDKSCFVPEGIPYIKMYNVRNQQIDFDYSPQYIIPSVHYGKLQRSILYPGDLLMNIVGPPLGKLAIIPDSLPESNTNQAAVLIRPFLYKWLINKYLFYYLEEMTEINSIATKGSAGQVNISLTQSQLMRIPLPPLEEQRKIVESIEKWIGLVDNIANGVKSILDNIENAKAKILELAIHGKLIPQDSSDEPAIELLRRINPAFKPSDNLHYEGSLPIGWELCRLEDILEYEQPQAYIVKSTEYSDKYITPVLTPGKTFVLGYTNESEGIYNALPVIIFDDFTTESKYVDFPFKVKSSAMKILRAKGEIDIRYVAFFMSITRLAGDTHKRYWISEYSKLYIPIPPFQEQKRIVAKIKELSMQLDLLVADTQ